MLFPSGKLSGLLANQPRHRQDLTPTQRVEVPESDIYDWKIHPAEGEAEGGVTDRVLSDFAPGDKQE